MQTTKTAPSKTANPLKSTPTRTSSNAASSAKKKSVTEDKSKSTASTTNNDLDTKEKKKKKKKKSTEESSSSDSSIKEKKKKKKKVKKVESSTDDEGKKKEVRKKKVETAPHTQQDKAIEQAETLRKAASKMKKPELASNPNAGGNSALKLRLDLNLDVDIKLKATIRGSSTRKELTIQAPIFCNTQNDFIPVKRNTHNTLKNENHTVNYTCKYQIPEFQLNKKPMSRVNSNSKTVCVPCSTNRNQLL
ncbi:hypothetical protein MBANPS3_001161 [Mucor bainieri]